MVTVLLAGGGTGGHVFPMVAVGDALKRADAAIRVVYVGTARGLEARVVPERGDTLELLHVLPLRGGGAMGFAKGAFRAAASIPEARALVRRIDPSVVLSVGGYAAGPVSLAARTSGVPLAILEPNSVLGFANRLLSPFARRAYTAFPEVERFFRPSIVVRAGVPLRGGFGRTPYTPRAGRVKLLVLGGSQGAKALNETVPRAIARAVREGADVGVVHQTGRGRDDVVRALYAELGVADSADVVPFIDDVPRALGDADVVVGRAGASSLAELCAIGRASILVPYPFAADDHQLKNARSLEQAGAAVCVPQKDATEDRLASEILRVAGDGEVRATMAEAAASRGLPDAAEKIAEDLVALAEGTRKSKRSA